MIAVSVKDNIFAPARQFEVPAGTTLADIVIEANVPEWFPQVGNIYISGIQIPDPGVWPSVRPREFDGRGNPVVVALVVVPRGGGRDQQKVMSTAVALAFAVAAGLVSAGALGPAGFAAGLGLGSSFAAGGTGAIIASVGLSASGIILARLLAPGPVRPKPIAPDENSNAGVSANALQPLEQLPVVFGNVIYSPPVVAPAYTTLQDGIITAHAIYGVAGRYDISEVLLNGTDIDLWDNVVYETREGTTSDLELTICTKSVIQESGSQFQGFTLEAATDKGTILKDQDDPDRDLPLWQNFRTRDDCDQYWVRLLWPAGQLETENQEKAFTPFRIEIRQLGDSTWLKLPVVHIQDLKLGKFYRQEIKLIFHSAEGQLGQRNTHYRVTDAVFAAYQTTGDGQTFEYNAESIFTLPTTVTDLIPTMTGPTTSGVTMSASDDDSGGSPAWQAGDKNTATEWKTASGVTAAWLKVQLGSADTVKSYRIICTTPTPGKNPKTWTFEGSNDDTNWTVLHTETGSRAATSGFFALSGMVAVFNIATENQGSYLYYRINVASVNSGDRILISELSLYTEHGLINGTGSSSIHARYTGYTDDGCEIWLEPSIFPKGRYEVRVQRGLAARFDQFSGDNDYQFNGSAADANFFEYYDASGVYKVKVDQSKYSADVAAEIVSTYVDEYPLSLSGTQVALIAIEAPSVQINSMSARFQSKLPTWDGANWNTIATTNNPAALARAILVGSNGIVDADVAPGTSKLETDAFEDWYDDCVDKGRECNFAFTGQAEEALRIIYGAGWATWRRPPWGVVREEDRTSENPVQVFSGLNSRGITISRGFADLPHAFRVEYQDELDDFRTHALTVYADGYSLANATRYEGITYQGLTNYTAAYLRGLLDIQQLYERDRIITFQTNIQHLISKRGNLVAVNHDVVTTAHRTAYIASVTTGGGNVTALVLEEEITILSGYSIVIRYRDGSTVTTAVTQGATTKDVNITTPFADPGTDYLDAGCICGFGPTDSVYIRGLIGSITETDDGSAEITALDEAPRLHAWPYAGAALDLDFVNQRYFWGGEVRKTEEFASYVLGAGTFGAHGLTPAADTDITVALSDAGFSIPGAFAAQLYPTSTPGTARAAFALNDGTDNEEVRLVQTTGGNLGIDVIDGGAATASIASGQGANAENGVAGNIETDHVRWSKDGAAGTEDTSAAMPTVTTLRVGKRNAANTQFAGAVGRIVLFDATRAQGVNNTDATTIRDW